MSRSVGSISVKHILRLASFNGGAKNDDIRSLAAWLYHVTDSGIGSEFAASFDIDMTRDGLNRGKV